MLAFLGYNRMDEPAARKLYDYACRGGKLIMTRAHLTTSTETTKILAGDFAFDNNALTFAVDPNAREIVSVKGKNVAINPTAKPFDEVLLRADDGREIAGKYAVGSGEIVCFNVLCYPSDPAIRAEYERVLGEHAAGANAAERVAVECADDVEYAAYKTGENTADVYVLAVDWYRNPDLTRSAILRIGDQKYKLNFKFGTLLKIVVDGNDYAYSIGENAVVTSVANGEIVVRGYGKTIVKGNIAACDFEIPVDIKNTYSVTLIYKKGTET